MSDIADAILEGELCQGCGEFLGCGAGYARFCRGCKPEDFGRPSSHKAKVPAGLVIKKKPIVCECGKKLVDEHALKQHRIHSPKHKKPQEPKS